MKRFFLTLSLLFVTFCCFSQKIKEKEVDKFTKQLRLNTDDVRMAEFWFRIRTVDTTIFLIMTTDGRGVGVIGDKEEILLLLDDDSVIKAYSTGIQSSFRNGASQRSVHQYSLTKQNLETLSKHKLKSVRKYLSDTYVDFDVLENKMGKMADLSKVVLSELPK